MAKARFVYRGQERQVEGVVRRSKQSGGSYDSYLSPDVQMFKAREGDCCMRILPPTWEDIETWGDGWEVQIWVHYGVGPDNGTYLCLDKMKGESCPICEARRGADPDEANELKPGWRALGWVIDRDNERAGPQVCSMPVKLFREINGRSVDKRTNAIILIDDPEEGYDVMFSREGTDKHTNYTAVDVDRDPTPLHDDDKTQEKWLEYVMAHPLPDVLNYYDANHIEAVLFGKANPKPADDDAPSRPARRSRRGDSEPEAEMRGSRRRSADDDNGDAGENPDGERRRRRPAGEPTEQENEPAARSSRRRLATEPEGNSEDAAGEGDEPPFDDDVGQTPTRTRRRAAPAEDEAGARTSRRSRAQPADESNGRSSRRGRSEPEADTSGPVHQARRSLNRLRDRATK